VHGVFGANGKNRPEDVRSFAINRTEVFGYVAPLGEEGEERHRDLYYFALGRRTVRRVDLHEVMRLKDMPKGPEPERKLDERESQSPRLKLVQLRVAVPQTRRT
jgi:hypothetical protein